VPRKDLRTEASPAPTTAVKEKADGAASGRDGARERVLSVRPGRFHYANR